MARISRMREERIKAEGEGDEEGEDADDAAVGAVDSVVDAGAFDEDAFAAEAREEPAAADEDPELPSFENDVDGFLILRAEAC